MPVPSLRTLFVGLTLMATVSCSRPPDLVGIDNPAHPAAATPEATRRQVLIVTTREATEVVGALFNDRRAPELGFASVVVSIPPNHVSGEIERAKRLPPDPATEFAVIDPLVFDTDDLFVAHLNRELAKLPPQDRELLFFVHGFNNTASDAILRIAQFAEDTGFRGVPVLFTWASAGKATRYVYDLNSTLVARPKLLEAAKILRRANARGVSVFAHSMGSFLLMETLVQAQLSGQFAHMNRIDNIMLAAPDIDIDLFRSQMQYLPKNRRDLFVFVSHDDFALRFSRRISGGVDRVGGADAEELAGLGVTVIDLSQVDDSSSGTHSKFAGSPEVVQLIGQGLQRDTFKAAPHAPTLVEVLEGVPVLRVLAP